jgi:hypothetical protein
LRRSLKRLLGLYLSVVTFGIGYLGVVFGEQRRAWEDRFSAAFVIYDERRPEPAPWSRPPPIEVPVAEAPRSEPASDSAASAAATA